MAILVYRIYIYVVDKTFNHNFYSFMNKIIVTTLIFFIVFIPSVFANNTELMLDKLRMDYNISLGDSACDELMYIDSGKDVQDMRGYPCYHRTGRYTMALFGPAGTMVTLFGKHSFYKERGYLTIRKKDDKLVWILDLEGFPNQQWFNSMAVKKSGAYEAFYNSAPIFEQNVSSIKWGDWWRGKEPFK